MDIGQRELEKKERFIADDVKDPHAYTFTGSCM